MHTLVALVRQAAVFVGSLHSASKAALAVLVGFILAIYPVAHLDEPTYAVKRKAIPFPY